MRTPIEALDDRTIGMIAAGEVVERPAQVVKELVENAVDAGASRITVTAQRGGFDRLRVEDDGHGIPESELALAVQRHATSKLRTAADLAAIHTLGFRGEALASIGMVADLRLASRPDGAEGRLLRVVDGVVEATVPVGTAPGTAVEVRDLFANHPARLAFQRRPATEASRIVDVVVDQALAHPEIAFRCIIDERVVLDTPASEDEAERVWDVLGRSAEQLLPLRAPTADAEAPGQERWTGWIGRPELSRGRGDGVHVLVNGRAVAAQAFLPSVRRGYATRLMVGRHPVAVLHLSLPADEVDVNVHPTKRDVRLRHSWRVLERLERAVRHTLEDAVVMPEVRAVRGEGGSGVSGARIDETVATRPPLGGSSGAAGSTFGGGRVAGHGGGSGGGGGRGGRGPGGGGGGLPSMPSWATSAGGVVGEAEPHLGGQRPGGAAGPAVDDPRVQATLPGVGEQGLAPALSSAERALHRWSGRGEGTSPEAEPPLERAEGTLDLPELVPLGQLDATYLLAEGPDGLYVIDQHAVHERIRYERLRATAAAWTAQPLLVPRPLDLAPREVAALAALSPRLEAIGLVIEADGAGWSLVSVPAPLADSDTLDGFIRDVLGQAEDEGDGLDAVDSVRDSMAFMQACRGAVKAHQRLSLAEQRRLLHDMRHVPHPWACVHGRPTVMRLTTRELELHFGREG